MQMGINDDAAVKTKPLTFFEMVWGMLPSTTKKRLVKNIADRCCERCGLPAGCTCSEDLLTSSSWTLWPYEAIDYIASFVSKLLRRLKRMQKNKTGAVAA